MNTFWSSIFLALLSNTFCIRVQQTPRRATKMIGESLTINCVFSGNSNPLYTTHWSWKAPDSESQEDISIGGRYEESIDAEEKAFSLRIYNLQVEDSGTFYCRPYTTSWLITKEYFGGGTELTVITGKPMELALGLLPPSPDEVENSRDAILICLIKGYYPDDLTISWKKNGIDLTSNIVTSQSAREQDGTFSTSSELIVPEVEWESGAKYTCTAFHPPSESNQTRTISYSKGHCPESKISVKILKPSFEEIWTQQTATIVCEITYSDSENVRVSWQANGNERTEGVETEDPELTNNESRIVSKLEVTAAEWDSGVEYACIVESRELPTAEKKYIRKLNIGEMHPPRVYLLPPSVEEVSNEKTATLVCLATGFYPADIYVGWMVNDTLLDSGYPSQPESETGNGSFSITSTLKVTAEDWNSGNSYSCLVGHPSRKTNLIRSINKSYGKPTLVNVSLVLTDSFQSCP